MASVYDQEDPSQDAAVNNVATNIFNNATGSAGGQQVQGGGMTGADQSQAVGSGGNEGSAAKQGSGQSSANSSKEVIRRNAGKAQSPIDLGEMSQGIQQSKKDLQAEADNYVTTQKANNYGVGNDTINTALNQGGDAYNQVGQRLQQARPEYQQFAQKTNTDYTSKLNDVSDAGLRNYFKQAGGPMSTAGEAAFDTMLLGKNNEFKKQREGVKNDALALQRDTADIHKKTDADAKAGYESGYDAETGRIKSTIQNQLDPIRQQAEAQAQAEVQRRQQMQSASLGDQYKTANYTDWLNNIGLELGQNEGEDTYLKEKVLGGLGYGQSASNGLTLAGTVAPDAAYNFINYNGTPVTANNYLDKTQAEELNRGYGLLGQASPGYSAAGPAGDAYTFNQGAAQAYLTKLLGERRASDAAEKQKSAEAESLRQLMAKSGQTEAVIREQQRKLGRLPSAEELNGLDPTAPGGSFGPAKGTAVGQAIDYGQKAGQKIGSGVSNAGEKLKKLRI